MARLADALGGRREAEVLDLVLVDGIFPRSVEPFAAPVPAEFRAPGCSGGFDGESAAGGCGFRRGQFGFSLRRFLGPGTGESPWAGESETGGRLAPPHCFGLPRVGKYAVVVPFPMTLGNSPFLNQIARLRRCPCQVGLVNYIIIKASGVGDETERNHQVTAVGYGRRALCW